MDNCPVCGVDRDVWGRLHNCRPNAPRETITAQLKAGAHPPQTSGAGFSGAGPSTYQYRDPDKRRVQVAAAMRAYRARKKLAT